MRTQNRVAVNVMLLCLFAFMASLATAQSHPSMKSAVQVTNRTNPIPHRNLDPTEVRDLLHKFNLDGVQNPDAAGCAVLNQQGHRVNSVPTSEIGDAAFFLQYFARDTFAQTITFTTVPLFTGSPLSKQDQVFNLPNPDDTDITTPFGIPVWALDATTGPWILVVRNDLGAVARCRFNVVP